MKNFFTFFNYDRLLGKFFFSNCKRKLHDFCIVRRDSPLLYKPAGFAFRLCQTCFHKNIKNGDFTVGGYIADVAKKLGGSIKATGFIRFVKGEGIEKRVDDFAAEVASMM